MEIKSKDFPRLSNLAGLGLKARREELSKQQQRLGRREEHTEDLEICVKRWQGLDLDKVPDLEKNHREQIKELRAAKRRLRLLRKQIQWEQSEIAEDESLLKELVKESVKT